jgi:hypothetical protein
MSENKNFFKSSQSLCFFFLGSVFLTSCTNHFGPFYIPSGYSHHHEEYKAPDGSELVTIPEKAPEEMSGNEASEEVGMVNNASSWNDEEIEQERYDQEDVQTIYHDTETVYEEVYEEVYEDSYNEYDQSTQDSVYYTENTYYEAPDYKTPEVQNSYRQETPKIEEAPQTYSYKELEPEIDQPTTLEQRAEVVLPEYKKYPEAEVSAAPSTFTEDANFTSAAQDLLDKLTREFGQPAEPVWLSPVNIDDPRNHDFEKAMRQAMMDNDYKIAYRPGEGPFTLVYGVNDHAGGASQAMITISLLSGDMQIAEKSGVYPISYEVSNHITPAYEAKPREGYKPLGYRTTRRDSYVSYPPEQETLDEPVSLFEQ